MFLHAYGVVRIITHILSFSATDRDIFGALLGDVSILHLLRNRRARMRARSVIEFCVKRVAFVFILRYYALLFAQSFLREDRLICFLSFGCAMSAGCGASQKAGTPRSCAKKYWISKWRKMIAGTAQMWAELDSG